MKKTPFTPFSQSINLFVFLAFLLNTALSKIDPQFLACNPTTCGNISIKFPFYIENQDCGFPGFGISCNNNNNSNPVIELSDSKYTIHDIFYENRSFRVSLSDKVHPFVNCTTPQVPQLQNLSLPERFTLFSNKTQLLLLYNCKDESELLKYKVDDCDGVANVMLAMFGDDPLLVKASNQCGSRIMIPADDYIRDEVNVTGIDSIKEVVERGFLLNWTASDCHRCERSGGKCGFDYGTYQFRCFCPDRPHAWQCQPDDELSGWKLGLVIGTASASALIVLLSIYILRGHYKRKYDSSRFVRTDSTLNELETSTIYFGIPIFSYGELEEATDGFNSINELGDGGFGTVYYGKLKDGREVAVKRLYEHNYRRHEQFMNEVEILTHLRHKNLVSLYGCTSHRSRALLLVYEYVSNGTVADHLYGDRVKSNLLTWPIRMSIAIETATALAYLHASDIIHRDVKTTNILLDNKLSVKVADFGLSRLFPADVTHVTTAPQGSPGYVDPEYHKCYQLTDKSDVYSFGVVLIELVSSMPAVDITRSRDEINLAYLAINRIQKRNFDELIDSSLGYRDDEEVTRMTTSVAELAFQCLQQDKDARPSMTDVLDELKRIAGVEPKEDSISITTGEIEVDALLKGKIAFSPDTVTAKWTSSSSCSTTTINASSVNH